MFRGAPEYHWMGVIPMPGKPKSGFSLMEMLIVVAIMGILAIASVPVAELAFIKGKEGELENNLSSIRQAIQLWKRDCRNAVALQIGIDNLYELPDSQLYPATLEDLAHPAHPENKYDIRDKDNNIVAEFYPKPYLNKIPEDPFVGPAMWVVHFASGTQMALFENSVTNIPAGHVGIFDVSCATDTTKRRGFVQAIDGTYYKDW